MDDNNVTTVRSAGAASKRLYARMPMEKISQRDDICQVPLIMITKAGMRAKRMQRRATAAPLPQQLARRLGGWYPVCTGGWWSAACWHTRARGEMHCTQSERLSREEAGTRKRDTYSLIMI